MASSDSEKVKVENLTEEETEFVLKKFGYSNIAAALNEEGKLNGVCLVTLDLDTLRYDLKIKIIQAKVFLKWVEKYTELGFLKEDISACYDNSSVNNPTLSAKLEAAETATVNKSSIQNPNVDYINRDGRELKEIIHLSKELRVNKGLRILQFPSPGVPLTEMTKKRFQKPIKKYAKGIDGVVGNFKPLYPIEENVNPIEWNDNNVEELL